MGFFDFDDSKVQSAIDNAMVENRNWKPFSEQLKMAHSYLYMQRQKEDPNDINRELAAAEHYMYARWQVCSGKSHKEIMMLYSVGYDPAKLLGYIPTILVIRLHVGHTWTRPSTDSIRWGLRGCDDGIGDRNSFSLGY